MDELINLVSQITNLPEGMASQVVEVVVGYLKEKLPAAIASQIDGALAGTGKSEPAGNLTKGLGDILSTV
jgi:hypothetical protein